MKQMKIAYIAHPVGGDVMNNLSRIGKFVREINLKEPNVVPFVPYFADCMFLSDDVRFERERGLQNDIQILARFDIDEMRLYGDRISLGMEREIRAAKSRGIKIRPMTTGTIKHLALLNKPVKTRP